MGPPVLPCHSRGHQGWQETCLDWLESVTFVSGRCWCLCDSKLGMGKLSSGTNVGVSRRSGAWDFMCLDNGRQERGVER